MAEIVKGIVRTDPDLAWKIKRIRHTPNGCKVRFSGKYYKIKEGIICV
ncbi:MAG: hypothetical protein U0T81_12735 [Saprospiraceae bacterium]